MIEESVYEAWYLCCSVFLFHACIVLIGTESVSHIPQCSRISWVAKIKDNFCNSLILSPSDVRYRLTDPEGQIRSYVEDVIRGAIPLRSLDENFSHKDELAKAVKENLSEKMAEYGSILYRRTRLIFIPIITSPPTRTHNSPAPFHRRTRERHASFAILYKPLAFAHRPKATSWKMPYWWT